MSVLKSSGISNGFKVVWPKAGRALDILSDANLIFVLPIPKGDSGPPPYYKRILGSGFSFIPPILEFPIPIPPSV